MEVLNALLTLVSGRCTSLLVLDKMEAVTALRIRLSNSDLTHLLIVKTCSLRELKVRVMGSMPLKLILVQVLLI